MFSSTTLNTSQSQAAGFKSLSAWDTKEKTPLELSVWYPSARLAKDLNMGNFILKVAPNAAISLSENKYPLIIIAHDSLANQFAYHYLASSLADSSYIVAAPKFNADNLNDMRLTYSFNSVLLRSKQLSYTLDTLALDQDLKNLIDFNRVYLISFGQASLASLISVGGKISQENYNTYCIKSERSEAEPFCNGYLEGFMRQFNAELNKWLAQTEEIVIEEEVLVPSTKTTKPKNQKQAETPSVSQTIKQTTIYQVPYSLEKLVEPRIKALVLVSPIYSLFFSQADLATVKMPILIVNTLDDPDYKSSIHAQNLRQLLPNAPNFLTIQDANFHSFFAECSPSFQAEFFEICLEQDSDTHDNQDELVRAIKSFLANQTN